MPLVSPLAQYSLLALVAIVAVAFVLGFRRAGGPQLVWAKPPRWAVWAFNLIGLALLINIVTIAILSAPTPLRQFWNEPANTFVAYAPYVWLPAFLVQAAWFGHVWTFAGLSLATPIPLEYAVKRSLKFA